MEKTTKVKKGWLTVEVGRPDDDDGGQGSQKFLIPISYLYHPLFQQLLDKSHEVYDYDTKGPLKLPCSIDEFLDIRRRVDKDSISDHHHHHPHPLALAFYPC
ncbi:ultraviolet-B receptor UVR8-like [Hibiscus syriacus]|uniref:Ultraviolet-B receptor UVR8-like n=1 Tax=Hibiscus syriacus TaxID=106335 RepID=A0A6A2X3G3_HIBSY|nr:auxin-responsive protein SAUR32-like [Hibiscus syriacus]KAE8669512.1 ultraviolet-B receptor UVR8-like [Hibiscus syriacus]